MARVPLEAPGPAGHSYAHRVVAECYSNYRDQSSASMTASGATQYLPVSQMAVIGASMELLPDALLVPEVPLTELAVKLYGEVVACACCETEFASFFGSRCIACASPCCRSECLLIHQAQCELMSGKSTAHGFSIVQPLAAKADWLQGYAGFMGGCTLLKDFLRHAAHAAAFDTLSFADGLALSCRSRFLYARGWRQQRESGIAPGQCGRDINPRLCPLGVTDTARGSAGPGALRCRSPCPSTTTTPTAAPFVFA